MKKENAISETKKSGRKPEVTKEQVIKAAEILQQQKRDITGWTLRDVIGGGGPKYLLSIWQEYNDNSVSIIDEVSVNTEGHILSPELEAKLNVFLADITMQVNNFVVESDQIAVHIADKKAKAAYETLMSTNRKLVDEQDLANRMIEDADSLLQQQQDELALLNKKNENLLNLKSTLEGQLYKADQTHARLEEAYEAIEKELIKEKAKVTELEKSEIRLNTKVEVAIADKKEASQKLVIAQKELTEREFGMETLAKQVEHQTLEINGLTQRLEGMNEKCS